jgi:hypothetical protein
MKIKALINYGKLPDAALNQKAIDVKNSLTGNPNFTLSVLSLADFSTLQQDFETALGLVASRDRVKIALKNQARLLLIEGLYQLALDVNAQANGDRAKLLSSGFDLSSTSDNSPLITTPTEFKISEGLNSGELKFSCKKVPAAVSYAIEYTDEVPTEDTKWISVSSTTKELTVKGLRSGTRIYGRIKAIGTKGQEASSEILSRIVQ